MRFPRMFPIALLITLLVSQSIAQEKSKAQGSGSDLRAEVVNVLNDFPQDLSTENQRYKLASTINLLLAKRIAENVRGYEQDPEFQTRFAKTYLKFLDSLKSGSTTFKGKDLESFTSLSTSAYEKNQEQFRVFYEQKLRTDPQLKGLSIEDVRKAMLQFSAWLYINERKTWDNAFTLTFVWPLCESAADVRELLKK